MENDPVSVDVGDVTVRLRPTKYGTAVTAEELVRFARIAVANAGPLALIRVGHGLTAHKAFQAVEVTEVRP